MSRTRSTYALLALSAVTLAAAGGAVVAAERPAEAPGNAARVPYALVEDRAVGDRLASPEDRYAVAGGCYTVETGGGFVRLDGNGLALTPDPAQAVPLHFQPLRLGEYLLATNRGRDTRYPDAWWDVRGYVGASSTAGVVPSSAVAVADAPSIDAEWRLVAVGDEPDAKTKGQGKAQQYLLSVPARSAALTVTGGALALQPGAGTPLTLRHVADDDPSDGDANGTRCATWPEIETGADKAPSPQKGGPTAPVKGFFEAHVHGMAFEFLGGELRCGRPWHPYGVEFALGDCSEENNALNGVLEVPLGGNPPEYLAEYDPVGWPTFRSWPRNRTLTHEQFYWRWLERAHAGGLRLMTNLLVENSALCREYPVKKNSCNEMDSVRLQAKRMFELQDYVDAQYGGPGEGWLRVVSTPGQAREVIRDGRLAVVLGIEISSLFDCEEFLDQPACTPADIDERLQEAFDMGVRQMELVNKFDNALSGVTGDSGTTGPVVNSGNRTVTGHWWDMRTCVPEEGDGHDHSAGREYAGSEADKTQISPTDATPGDGEGVDALAGRVLDTFGTVRGLVAPVYGPGPHCNSRGLTDLGEHLVRAMVAKGMFFDPDHMSGSAQRAALDLIEHEIIPAEQAAAAREGRAAVQPSVISSHSWGNDVTYQRLYALDGAVAPYAGEPRSYARDWAQRKTWALEQGVAEEDFGIGYGADTNGLGGQPGKRSNPGTSLAYTADGFAAPIGDVRLTQQKSGLRTFDITKEGVSHYGLFADWFQEVALAADDVAGAGGRQEILDDMLKAPEQYLSMWERAVYGARPCVADQSALQVEDLHAALGLNVEGFLDAIGQPADRSDDAYVYCAQEDGQVQAVDVVFDADGTATAVRPSAQALPALLTADVPVAADGHDHLHLPVQAELPGGAGAGLVLLTGLTGAASRLLRRG